MMYKRVFEKVLVLSRMFVILPVIFGIIGAVILFFAATIDVAILIKDVFASILTFSFPDKFYIHIVSEIVGAVDLYLIAVVMLIFSFGLYELFISEIDYDKHNIPIPSILSIDSLDELKDKLAKVIVMVLVVSYFQHMLNVEYEGSLSMMYFALSITALSVGVYLLRKDTKIKRRTKPIES